MSRFILTIRDTFTNWISAKILEHSGSDQNQLALNSAQFVFSTLCQFGFTNCIFVTQDQDFFLSFVKHIRTLWSSLDVIGLRPDEIFERVDPPASSLMGVQLLEFVQLQDWTSKLDAWLFRHRTSIQVFFKQRDSEKSNSEL